jgi:hypothetical protein
MSTRGPTRVTSRRGTNNRTTTSLTLTDIIEAVQQPTNQTLSHRYCEAVKLLLLDPAQALIDINRYASGKCVCVTITGTAKSIATPVIDMSG